MRIQVTLDAPRPIVTTGTMRPILEAMTAAAQNGTSLDKAINRTAINLRIREKYFPADHGPVTGYR